MAPIVTTTSVWREIDDWFLASGSAGVVDTFGPKRVGTTVLSHRMCFSMTFYEERI